jgi:hypothetical protein
VVQMISCRFSTHPCADCRDIVANDINAAEHGSQSGAGLDVCGSVEGFWMARRIRGRNRTIGRGIGG